MKIAIGFGQIKSDEIIFRHKDETWAFNTYDVLGYPSIAQYNGIHYVAKVKDLRALARKIKEAAHG